MTLRERIALDLFDHNRNKILDESERRELDAVELLTDKNREEIFRMDHSVIEAINELWLARVIDENRTRQLASREELETLFDV